MAIPELVKKSVSQKLDAYCKNRIPVHIRNQIRLSYKFRGDSVTLFEERPYYLDQNIWTSLKIAQMRYEDDQWTLYCADRNEKLHLYIDLDASSDFDTLLNEIDKDPTCIFWG